MFEAFDWITHVSLIWVKKIENESIIWLEMWIFESSARYEVLCEFLSEDFHLFLITLPFICTTTFSRMFI